MNRRAFACMLGAACVPLRAQQNVTDGEDHGDPPYMLESGWQPLLNGKDLTGWVGQDGKPHGWITTRFVRWERLLGPTRLGGEPGPSGTILNSLQGRTNNLVTAEKFGDVELYLEFLIAKGSNSGVYLHGLYEVQVFDSFGSLAPVKTSDGGGIYHRWINEKGVGGSAPLVNASRPAGQWQYYHIWFRGPRFDGSGKKTQNAKFLKVNYNGLTVQQDVEVEGGTRAHMELTEAATNPLMLQGDHGPVAYRNIYVRPLREMINR